MGRVALFVPHMGASNSRFYHLVMAEREAAMLCAKAARGLVAAGRSLLRLKMRDPIFGVSASCPGSVPITHPEWGVPALLHFSAAAATDNYHTSRGIAT